MKSTKNMTENEKMALAISQFRMKDQSSPLLCREHHDKENSCVVATDSRRLLATTANFNPCFENADGAFPKWAQVFPAWEKLTVSASLPFDIGRGGINFDRFRKILAAAVKLGDATGAGAWVWFKVGGRPVYFNPDFIADLSVAMEASGEHQIYFSPENPEGPAAHSIDADAARVSSPRLFCPRG